MSGYNISQVYESDLRSRLLVCELLESEGIKLDPHLDYTCAIFENGKAIATGSCFGNTLRCLAVSKEHQGEQLMNTIITHLIDIQASRNEFKLFLYTKCESAKFFVSLGFYEVARVEGKLVLMENRRNGFSSYLDELAKNVNLSAHSSAVVMNANPFTNGHLHLIKTASIQSDVVHLFCVSEDKSLFPYTVRKRLIVEGVKQEHLSNVIVHDSGSYIISSATFPSYFLGTSLEIASTQAKLDATIFCKICQTLGITERFCGEEKLSPTTAVYNKVMANILPKHNIRFTEIPRITIQNNLSEATIVSASYVRQLIKDDNMNLLRELVPETTYTFLMSDEARPVIERIKVAEDIIHH